MIIITVFFYSWLITHFQPLQDIINIINTKRLNRPVKWFVNNILNIPKCMMCCGFWLMLIMSGSILMASIMAFSNFWYKKLLGYYEEYEKMDM